MEYISELLPEEFLKEYKTKRPKWGYNGLGEIVYKRTYSRLKEDGTNEEWWETVARCINGAQKIGADYTKEKHNNFTITSSTSNAILQAECFGN